MCTPYEGYNLAGSLKQPEVGGIWSDVGGRSLQTVIIIILIVISGNDVMILN